MATETLVCQSCDQQFERERVRGRKPKQCPDCKESGNKPKEDTKPKVIYKSEDEPRKSTVVDMTTGERLLKDTEPEIEIPDNATMTNEVKWLRKYDSIIVDGVEFNTTIKKDLKVKNHEHNNCRFAMRHFTHNTHSNVMYFELAGVSGMCAGKWRFIDAERVGYTN